MQSKYLNSKLIINFDVDRNILSSSARVYEEKLKSNFIVPFFVVNGLPEGADPSITRFLANSLGGHSKVEISQNKITLTTNFDANFCFDIDKIIQYLLEKSEFLKQVIEPGKVTFMGIVINFDTMFEEAEILPYLAKLTGLNFLQSGVRDFTYRYSKIYNNDYVANVTVTKFQKVTFNIPMATALTGIPVQLKPEEGKTDTGITITIDINNKILLQKGQRFDINNLNAFFKPFDSLIKNSTLDDLVVGNLK